MLPTEKDLKNNVQIGMPIFSKFLIIATTHFSHKNTCTEKKAKKPPPQKKTFFSLSIVCIL